MDPRDDPDSRQLDIVVHEMAPEYLVLRSMGHETTDEIISAEAGTLVGSTGAEMPAWSVRSSPVRIPYPSIPARVVAETVAWAIPASAVEINSHFTGAD